MLLRVSSSCCQSWAELWSRCISLPVMLLFLRVYAFYGLASPKCSVCCGCLDDFTASLLLPFTLPGCRSSAVSQLSLCLLSQIFPSVKLSQGHSCALESWALLTGSWLLGCWLQPPALGRQLGGAEQLLSRSQSSQCPGRHQHRRRTGKRSLNSTLRL